MAGGGGGVSGGREEWVDRPEFQLVGRCRRRRQLLTALDGVEGLAGVFVIAATSRSRTLLQVTYPFAGHVPCYTSRTVLQVTYPVTRHVPCCRSRTVLQVTCPVAGHVSPCASRVDLQVTCRAALHRTRSTSRWPGLSATRARCSAGPRMLPPSRRGRGAGGPDVTCGAVWGRRVVSGHRQA